MGTSGVSVWDSTRTYFPLVLRAVERFFSPPAEVCVVGASDGKFVIPLARRGWRVIAIEMDTVAIDGGLVEFPEKGLMPIAGLAKRLELEGLQEGVEIIRDDFLTCTLPPPCAAVFTSCSWHYSHNHMNPLAVFIKRMQAIVAQHGLFAAEYMMPCEDWHYGTEHYVQEAELRRYFEPGAWCVVDEFYTPPFPEGAHVGNLEEHTHRMGFLMARKTGWRSG